MKPKKESHKSAEIPSKAEVSLFRSSPKQYVCVELLRQGYHKSFTELFTLLASDRDRRAAAKPGSPLWRKTPLDEQPDKLETMKKHLGRAEQAESTCTWTVVCEQYLALGQYFSAPGELWLSLHFHHSCVDREQGGASRPAAEARACMADIYLQLGDLEQARQQAEHCIQQAERYGFLDSADRPLKLRAQKTLWRIYSGLADAALDTADHSEALKLLYNGYNMATETGDRQMEEEVSYWLGRTYQSAGDHGTAKKFFRTCVQISDSLQDADGLGKAYSAMAKSLQSEGYAQESLQCLETLANVARNNGLQHTLVDADLRLGNLYYTMGQYERACKFFLRGYEAACVLEDVDLLQKAQVSLASVRAHSLSIRKYSADLQSSSASRAVLQRLLAWKGTRERPSTDGTDSTTTAAWY